MEECRYLDELHRSGKRCKWWDTPAYGSSNRKAVYFRRPEGTEGAGFELGKNLTELGGWKSSK
jgi:hypothetical protein